MGRPALSSRERGCTSTPSRWRPLPHPAAHAHLLRRRRPCLRKARCPTDVRWRQTPAAQSRSASRHAVKPPHNPRLRNDHTSQERFKEKKEWAHAGFGLDGSMPCQKVAHHMPGRTHTFFHPLVFPYGFYPLSGCASSFRRWYLRMSCSRVSRCAGSTGMQATGHNCTHCGSSKWPTHSVQ